MGLLISMTFHSVIPAQDSNLREEEARKEEQRGLSIPLGKLRLLTGGGQALLHKAKKGKLRNVLVGKEVVRSPTALV